MNSTMTSLKGLRILYLHELEGAPGGEKQRLLEKAVGKQCVKAPNLKTRKTILWFVLLFALLALLCVSATIASAVLAKWYVGLSVALISVLFLSATYLVGGRGVTQFLFHQSIKIAERKFREMRPNVIVGSNYGAVVALAMDMPRVPMLLLTPATERFAKFMRLKMPFTLADCPYTIIVHGSNDKTVPLDDSIKLVETSEVGRCRLEVVDDGHSMKSVTSEDLRGWIEEVYSSGTSFALQMAREGNKKIDPALFQDSDFAKPDTTIHGVSPAAKAVSSDHVADGSRKSSKASTTDV